MPPVIDSKTLREIIREKSLPAFLPVSTYRLQFNSHFNFKRAKELAGYFTALGVDALYASPFFQARPGSLHGYDVTDPNRINPEIGTEEEALAFAETLLSAGMGFILDVVPNHMGIGPSNRWWQDVLENGRSSLYARFFDIDWDPVKKELKDRLLLPMLGNQYGTVLENQELQLVFEEGSFFVRYWDSRFPVAPETYTLILQPRFKEWEARWGEEHAGIRTLKELLKDFSDLGPAHDAAGRTERNRRKEMAKQRLAALVLGQRELRDVILQSLQAFNGRKGDSASFDLLDDLLKRQHYRLSYWRVAAHEINYRRFFNLNDLAAIRMEDPQVFEAYHRLAFRLISENKVHGLRIDHPDGLAYPLDYLHRLQRHYLLVATLEEIKHRQGDQPWESEETNLEIRRQVEECLRDEEFQKAHPLYVIVEKILDRKEGLPEHWPVHGTVGYCYLNGLNGLFVDRNHEKEFDVIYEKFTGQNDDFAQLVYEKKKLFAAFDMTSEINMLGYRLDQLSEQNRRYRDFTLNDLITAIREVIACFPVYRTYTEPEATAVSERDAKYIHIAIEKAKGQHPALSPTIFEFLRDVLLLKIHADLGREEDKAYREFILRFQQLTAPIMAKGLEDTVFYLYNRFIALNEVGGDPQHFGFSKGDFHRLNYERNKQWPASMITTSTHDTKRSEDVRLRLSVLSEIPEAWDTMLGRWVRCNEKHKTPLKKGLEPNRNLEYQIYQTLVGVWPDEPMEQEAYEAFCGRIWGYVEKSVREAKVETNWHNPNVSYEEAVKKFVDGILARTEGNTFLELFLPFQKRISEYGKWNALAALAIKLGSPGVPDTYQGNEIWDYSLVDPDNRRPVDFEKRKHLLEVMLQKMQKSPSREDFIRDLTASKEDGSIKLFMLWQGLALRKQYRTLFVGGDYLPLEIKGDKHEHVFSFLRKHEDRIVIVSAARFLTKLWGLDQNPSWTQDLWQDTHILVPKEMEQVKLYDAYSGRTIEVQSAPDGPFIDAGHLFKNMNAVWLTNF